MTSMIQAGREAAITQQIHALDSSTDHEQLHDYKVQVEQSSYGEKFYAAYAAYLKEPQVRRAHDWIFSILCQRYFEDVVDLGCGRSNEFYHYFCPWRYLGIDENAKPLTKPDVIKANYRDCDLHALLTEHLPTRHITHAFVSLFSSEITAHWRTNYQFYQHIFSTCPSIQAGLVSGFYYEKRKDQPVVGETGGVQSYQTLEAIEDTRGVQLFSEARIIMPVPSKMFGDDVYEVWKFFERRTE